MGVIDGSATTELPVDFVKGARLAFPAGAAETEALEAMLTLFEESLEILPAVDCGVGS
jgi:hypothetical protein